MNLLGAQYYRPPTPGPAEWEADVRRMKEAGLNTIQLWAVWGWIEPEPGHFVFDDYDRLVDLAEREGLRVVISTIADVQPFWVPRLYPHTLMIDEKGRTVRGTPRAECLSGLTPGCCTDHIEIKDLTMRFMTAIAEHYRGAPAFEAWDCWNETRWCVHCEDWVCYCPASLAAYREFLRKRYGTLERLGEAWGRRLISWDDVAPARAVGLVNPALMDFGRWMMERARDTAAWRCQALRRGDPDHFITAHSAGPVTGNKGRFEEPPFARGNDFDIARELDGFGTSSFPAWFGFDPADFGSLLEVTRAVARPKPFWTSELQGGAFNQGFHYGPAVAAGLQQFWTWSSYARGAKAVLYWCWRDEVWGVESGGYGIAGQDGFAADRIRALQVTGSLLAKHADTLDRYQPDPAKAGIVFDSDSALFAVINREQNTEPGTRSVYGTMLALERQRIPFDLLDGRALTIPADIRFLILPSALCLKPAAAAVIETFIRGGGLVFCEAGTGMFTENGFYFDRAADRPLVGALGIGQARRSGDAACGKCLVPAGTWGASAEIELRGALWSIGLVPPKTGKVIARNAAGDALLIEVPLDKGRLIMSGAFPANAYVAEYYEGYETLLQVLARESGALPDIRVECDKGLKNLFVRGGRAGNARLVFLLNAGEERTVTVQVPERVASATEWVSGKELQPGRDGRLSVTVPGPGYAVLECG